MDRLQIIKDQSFIQEGWKVGHQMSRQEKVCNFTQDGVLWD